MLTDNIFTLSQFWPEVELDRDVLIRPTAYHRGSAGCAIVHW